MGFNSGFKGLIVKQNDLLPYVRLWK